MTTFFVLSNEKRRDRSTAPFFVSERFKSRQRASSQTLFIVQHETETSLAF